MNYVVTTVPTREVPKAWHRAVPWLKPAVAQSGGRYDMRTLFQSLLVNRSLLWLVLDEQGGVAAAFTTHIARYPLKDILAVDFIGGRGVGDWLTNVTDTLDRFVTAHRLAGVETCARPGWKHLLAERGWSQRMNFFEKGAPASGAMQG